MKYLPEEDIPRKAKNPRQLLLNGELLPKVLKHRICSKDIFWGYFYERHITIPCNPVFCYLAILRYYHLPIDLEKDFMPPNSHEHKFFPVMKHALTNALADYCNRIQREYEDKQHGLIELNKLNKYKSPWLTRRQDARSEYRNAPAQKIKQYLRYSYDFSGKILACFKAEDYAKFIGDIENFYVFYFPLYLNHFCEKYGITIYDEMDDVGKCYLEDKASFWHAVKLCVSDIRQSQEMAL